MNNAILLISCPDQKGITAAVTQFVFDNGGNILHADQHIDDQDNIFFMRLEFALEGFKLKRGKIKPAFEPLAKKFKMTWQLFFSDEKIRMAVFVSKPLHCLYDIIFRQRTGQLACALPLIVSNHQEAGELAAKFDIKFVHIPKDKKNKARQEAREKELLLKENIDLIVLARYHQIFSASFVTAFVNRIINIHHSFLPAFVGKDPYAQAYKKGVKLIGATSHYVTAELDQGPIIEQQTVRISHRDTLDDLKHKGQDLEKVVLYRALRWHLERKVLCFNNKTVVFA
jgi:formyltetrahydrofolate deformylase